MNRKIVLIIILTAIFFGTLNAQIITDRPDQTESSSTVSKGTLQLESGILIGFESENPPTTRQILLPTNLFRYGITNWIELRILSQFETIKIEDKNYEGISDLEIGAKVQLLKKEEVNTEIAFLSHLIVPTGTHEITSDNFGLSNKLSISHGINETVGVGYNIGYNYFGEGNGDVTYSLAFGVGINDRVGIYVEPYGELAGMEDFISNFDAGFTYLVNNDLQFDFSFGVGLNQQMNYISIGCSWAMNKD